MIGPARRGRRRSVWTENAERCWCRADGAQATILVVLFGFFVLGLLAYRTYQAKPPIPERAVAPSGEVVYTERDVERGQEVFLNNGLMEYGSVYGHGAYLGPDYTADYLRSAEYVRRRLGGARSDAALRETIEVFRTNRYDERTGVPRAHPRAGASAPAARRPLLALLLRAHHQAWPEA